MGICFEDSGLDSITILSDVFTMAVVAGELEEC